VQVKLGQRDLDHVVGLVPVAAQQEGELSQ
jgi:hypothetical protein